MKYVLNLLLILLIASGCNPHREEIAVFEDTRSKQDVIDDFDKLEFKEGINDWADLARAHGLKVIEEYLINKNIIK